MTTKLSQKFHGVGIGQLSNILAVNGGVPVLVPYLGPQKYILLDYQWVYMIFIQIYQCELHIFGHHLYLCQSTLYRFRAAAVAANTSGAVLPGQNNAGSSGNPAMVWFLRKLHKYFGRLCSFFGKVNHDTWEKFIPLRDSLFHSRNNLPSTKRFHRKMLKTCMSFLLEFVYCAFFSFFT